MQRIAAMQRSSDDGRMCQHFAKVAFLFGGVQHNPVGQKLTNKI
jgi:hypothetical protein